MIKEQWAVSIKNLGDDNPARAERAQVTTRTISEWVGGKIPSRIYHLICAGVLIINTDPKQLTDPDCQADQAA